MKKSLLFLTALIFSFNAFTNPVNENTAKQVAKNFIYERTGISQGKTIFNGIFTGESNDIVLYYILSFNKGFVIVCADDIISPVLAYSTESIYSEKNMPPQMIELLDNYQNQIEYAVKNKSKSFPGTASIWEKYSVPFDEFNPTKSSKDVAPLLGTIEWNQGSGWNVYCPPDAGGSGGYTYVGCVATATGQIMRYWNYPSSGIGSYSYTHETYGLQSADFENTVIDWASMSNEIPTDAAALLLYQIGVALEMDYSPDGSGANTADVHYILEKYYKYKNTATHIRKINYTDMEWINILRNEVDHARPVLYRGANIDGENGHAFVLDGYSGDHFHINWGWGGTHNGDFLLTNLTPSYDFSYGNSCCIKIEPDYTEPYSLTANLTDDDVSLNWTTPLEWYRYGYMYSYTSYTSGGDGRYTLFDNDDYGFSYPVVIIGISHAFYEHADSEWSDTTYTFRIYNSGGTMIFESEELEAKHREEVFYELTTPLEISDDVYVGIHSVNGSGHPSSLSVKKEGLGETHSYYRSGSSWSVIENVTDDYGLELICGIEISGSGLLKSGKSSTIENYQIFRDDNFISEVSGDVFSYNDNDVAVGNHSFCIKTVYDEGESICSEYEYVEIVASSTEEINIVYDLYPNPASSFINIQLNEYPAAIRLYDISGKEVYTVVISGDRPINIENLSNGIYIMHIESDHFSDKLKLQILK